MVQRIEHLGTKLQFESFGQFKTFANSQIQVPVTRSFKNIAPGTIASGCRYRKRASVLENDGADHSRDFLQSDLWLGSDNISTRFVRKVRCPHAAAYAERLAGHERVNSVEAPATDHVIQRRMN